MNVRAIRQQGLDKFYTLPSVAKTCIDRLSQRYEWDEWDWVLEPSAGNGSFFSQIPFREKIGIDIEPENPEIRKQDFFTYRLEEGRGLVIGNPPFGRVSSLAVKFFNYAANSASVIAFIVPRTFRRVSVQSKLHKHFWLVDDMDIPTTPCAFSPPMSAKCCFQIWERRDQERLVEELPTTHEDWNFLPFGPLDEKGQPTPPAGADFAIRAYGGKCGEIKRNNLETLRPKSWHWIKANIPIDELIKKFQALNYDVSKDTARQNSIGRAELVRLYST
jgi:hypothetical protein